MSNQEEIAMTSKVSLLFICVNPLCPHRFHIGEFSTEDTVYDPLIIGRVGGRSIARLNKIADSDSYHKALATIGHKHQRNTTQEQVPVSSIPYINREQIAEYLQDESTEEKENKATVENMDAVSGTISLTTEQIRNHELDVVEFVADPSVSQLEATQSRVNHYHSETLRLEALRISLDLKNK